MLVRIMFTWSSTLCRCWFGYTFRPHFWILEGPRAAVIVVSEMMFCYPPEVNSMKYCCLGVLPQRRYSGHYTPLGHYTDRSNMGLGQHKSLGGNCGPHTASSVFLLLLIITNLGN